MNSSQQLTDQRGAAFARLANRVVEALNDAVARRAAEGKSATSIAQKIGCHRTSLSRALNGTSANLTLRTISDILWATDHEPVPFGADPLESICDNHFFDDLGSNDLISVFEPYPTKTINMNRILWGNAIRSVEFKEVQKEFHVL